MLGFTLAMSWDDCRKISDEPQTVPPRNVCGVTEGVLGLTGRLAASASDSSEIHLQRWRILADGLAVVHAVAACTARFIPFTNHVWVHIAAYKVAE